MHQKIPYYFFIFSGTKNRANVPEQPAAHVKGKMHCHERIQTDALHFPICCLELIILTRSFIAYLEQH